MVSTSCVQTALRGRFLRQGFRLPQVLRERGFDITRFRLPKDLTMVFYITRIRLSKDVNVLVCFTSRVQSARSLKGTVFTLCVQTA